VIPGWSQGLCEICEKRVDGLIFIDWRAEEEVRRVCEVEEEEDRGENRVAHIAISDDCVQLRKQGAWAAGENRDTKRMLVMLNTRQM
jgi:hypothetical protein